MGYLLPLRGLMFWLCLIVQTFYSPTIKVNLVESSAWIDNATCEVCSQERERRLNKPLIYYLSLPTTWWPKHLIAKLTSVEKRILYLQETYTSLVVLCCMSRFSCMLDLWMSLLSTYFFSRMPQLRPLTKYCCIRFCSGLPSWKWVLNS